VRVLPFDWRVLARKDVLAGLMFMALAVLGLWASRTYPVGTALRMSTGYVPRLLCWILLGLGAVIAIQGILVANITTGSRDTSLWRPLLFAPLSLLVFALTIERFGVVVATMLLVAVGAAAGRGLRTFEVAISAIVLAAVTVATFVWGLGLTIPVWPEW